MTPFSMLRCCASVAPQAQHLKPMLQRTYVKCCAVALRSCAYRSERSATLNPRCAFTCSYTCTPKAQQRNILHKPLSLLIPRVALWVSKAQQKRNTNAKSSNSTELLKNNRRNGPNERFPRCAFTCSYTCTPKAQQRNILRKPLSLLIPRVALWVSKAQQKRNMNPKCCNGRWLSGNGQRNKRNVCRKYRFGLNLEVHQ